jgi:hypothetical protein
VPDAHHASALSVSGSHLCLNPSKAAQIRPRHHCQSATASWQCHGKLGTERGAAPKRVRSSCSTRNNHVRYALVSDAAKHPLAARYAGLPIDKPSRVYHVVALKAGA